MASQPFDEVRFAYEDAGDRPHIREDWQPSQETRAFHPELAASLDIKKKSAGPMDQRDHKEEAQFLDRVNPQLDVITQMQAGARLPPLAQDVLLHLLCPFPFREDAREAPDLQSALFAHSIGPLQSDGEILAGVLLDPIIRGSGRSFEDEQVDVTRAGGQAIVDFLLAVAVLHRNLTLCWGSLRASPVQWSCPRSSSLSWKEPWLLWQALGARRTFNSFLKPFGTHV